MGLLELRLIPYLKKRLNNKLVLMKYKVQERETLKFLDNVKKLISINYLIVMSFFNVSNYSSVLAAVLGIYVPFLSIEKVSTSFDVTIYRILLYDH